MFEPRKAKSRMVGVNFSPEERRALENYATLYQISMSEFVRRAVGETIRRIETFNDLSSRSQPGECWWYPGVQSMETFSDSQPERERTPQGGEQVAGGGL